eukprot:scaffold1805_cov104-Cylindrotheca_fusiformis.AAC.11
MSSSPVHHANGGSSSSFPSLAPITSTIPVQTTTCCGQDCINNLSGRESPSEPCRIPTLSPTTTSPFDGDNNVTSSSLAPTSSPTINNIATLQTPLNGRFFLCFPLFFGLTLAFRRTHQYQNRRRRRRFRRSADNNGENDDPETGFNDAGRLERLLSKLYIEVVLPDKSNVNPESLKSNTSKRNKSKTVISNNNGDDHQLNDEEKEIAPDSSTDILGHKEKTIDHDKSAPPPPLSVPNTTQHSFCQVLSSWATTSREQQQDCCCCSICLEAYRPGESICMAKTPSCDHLFHKDCLLEWMMQRNDACPLCRENLMG